MSKCTYSVLIVAVMMLSCSSQEDDSTMTAVDAGDPITQIDVAFDVTEEAQTDAETSSAQQAPFLYREMALTVLENLVHHAATPDGDWLFTEMKDTIGLAPRVLFDFGDALDRTDLAEQAMLTIGFYDTLALEVAQQMASGDDVDADAQDKMFGGAPSLVDAYVHTGERHYRDFLSLQLLMVGQEILNDPSLIEPGGQYAVYGPLFTGGAIVTVNVELALAIREVEGDFDAIAQSHIDMAAALLVLLDAYRMPAGFYDSHGGSEPDTGENINMVMALATMYVATEEQQYLDAAIELIDALEPLWDEQAGAYRLEADSNYIGLAENNLILYGELLLYEYTQDETILERAVQFYQFAETALYAELPAEGESGGFRVILHDNQGLVSDWYWCSGCNFFALNNILMLNELMGNQPLSVEP